MPNNVPDNSLNSLAGRFPRFSWKARTGIAALLLAAGVAGAYPLAGGMIAPATAQERSGSKQTGITPLPADKTTRHSISIDGETLAFDATAGTIKLFDQENGKAIASIAYMAFTRKNADGTPRPVTFAMNGGPGYASAWLNLGAMGPWRLDMSGAAIRPSAPPVTKDNPETWLAFTDLVFLDPAGTGYGRIEGGSDVRKHLWSVNGDVSSLATVIRRWLQANGRMGSPVYLTGESYGGYRVPEIAHRLQTREGVGVNGLVMVSPVLDFDAFRSSGPMSHVFRLPSYAAAAAQVRTGEPMKSLELAKVEAYARGDFLLDLVRGPKNKDALERIIANVTRLTGLEESLVRRFGGRIPASVFAREIHRSRGRVGSMYDGTVTGLDPDRYARRNHADDQLRLGMHAPMIRAMTRIYADKLKWDVGIARYVFHNPRAFRNWNWGDRQPEAITELSKSLALDPAMRALVVHGATDLVTPYFGTRLVLAQMPRIGKKERIRFRLYDGGHMFYSEERSRKAFRDDAKAMIAPPEN